MQSNIFPRKGNLPYRMLSLLYARKIRLFEKSAMNPKWAQQRQFRQLINGAKDTVFGRQYQFSSIRSLEEYRQKVPIQTYSEIQALVDRVVDGEQGILRKEKVISFVETSGTSSKAKLIPVTNSWAKQIQTAQILWIIALLRDFPDLSKGSALRLVSSASERYTSGGIPIGANTGRMQDALPTFLRGKSIFPDCVSDIKDFECKTYVQLRLALQEPIGSWTTANPSTILLYCRKLQEYKDAFQLDLVQGTVCHGPATSLSPEIREKLAPILKRRPVPIDWTPASLWPLWVINCWKGGPAQFFVEQLKGVLGADIPIRDVGITASEGYFAIPLSGEWDGGVLWTLGELLEFRDINGKMHWAWELEQGERYELVISTLSGLYRYDLQDVVEVTGFYQQTPIIRFVGKAGRFLNATGEKIAEEQFLRAVQRSSSQIIGATARTVWKEVPHIEVAVEMSTFPEDLANDLEVSLQAVNIEYAQKRSSGRLHPLQIKKLSTGTYFRYRNLRISQGACETQVKDLLIAVNEKEWNELLSCSQALS